MDTPRQNPLVGFNLKRAGWALAALQAFMEETGLAEADGFDTAIGDLLGDLMHLAVELGLDFDGLLAKGESYHDYETASVCDSCSRSTDAEADGVGDLCIECAQPQETRP